MSNTSGMTTYS